MRRRAGAQIHAGLSAVDVGPRQQVRPAAAGHLSRREGLRPVAGLRRKFPGAAGGTFAARRPAPSGLIRPRRRNAMEQFVDQFFRYEPGLSWQMVLLTMLMSFVLCQLI